MQNGRQHRADDSERKDRCKRAKLLDHAAGSAANAAGLTNPISAAIPRDPGCRTTDSQRLCTEIRLATTPAE